MVVTLTVVVVVSDLTRVVFGPSTDTKQAIAIARDATRRGYEVEIQESK